LDPVPLYNCSGSESGSDLAQKFQIRIHNTAKPTALSFLSLQMAPSLTPEENRIGAVTLMIFFSSGDECFLVYSVQTLMALEQGRLFLTAQTPTHKPNKDCEFYHAVYLETRLHRGRDSTQQ
jgi:hypothetical protein